MKKKQKFLTAPRLFFLVLPILIVFLFLMLSPKISAQLFPFKRHAALNEFIDSTKASGQIDSQKYWQFREFYSPGYFTFSRQGIDIKLLKQAETKIKVKFDNKKVNLSFLVFSSPLVSSVDMLTTTSSINEIFQSKVSKEAILFKDKNSLIYKQDSGTIAIVFLLSNENMRKANGFFDYNDRDKIITEDKNWFNVTAVKTN
jgi:hypothetical protein